MSGELWFHVKPDDIAAGVRQDCDLCPTTLAMEREVGRGNARTGTEIILLFIDGEIRHYRTPKEVQWFVMLFDAGFRTLSRPFQFKLDDSMRIPWTV